ncbi:MAG: nuclear transport factor 2 family protein [Pseudomonadota bacterium]
MTSSVETFFAAWGEPDAEKRDAMLSACLADAASYSDPRSQGRLTGADIAAYIGQFSANAPGWAVSVETAQEVNGYQCVRVVFGGQGPDGKGMAQHGTYFTEADADGKLTLLAGFAGASA